MIKNKVALEVTIGERRYSLDLESDSPLGEVYDAITQMRSFVIQRIHEENEASKPKTADKEEDSCCGGGHCDEK